MRKIQNKLLVKLYDINEGLILYKFIDGPINKIPIIFVWQSIIVGPLSTVVFRNMFWG